MPRIVRVVRGCDFIRDLRAADEERADIKPKVPRSERHEVFCAELEKAHGGAEPRGVLRVVRVEMVLLQMDEGSGDLDEPFVKERVPVAALEPEVFEDIVRLVVLGRIEAGEVARVVRVGRGRGAGAEATDEGGDAVAFFHRTAGRWKTILPGMERDKINLSAMPSFGTTPDRV